MDSNYNTPKKLGFKYSITPIYYLWQFGSFAACFGVPLAVFLALRTQIGWEWNDWTAAFAVVAMMIWLACSMFIADYFSALITEKNGTALFGQTELEIALAGKTIRIPYTEIADITYHKVVGSDDTWSFLPTGKLIIRRKDGGKIHIHSSRHEARKKKWEHGLLWKYKLNKDGSAPVPDMLLWHVCAELGKHTGGVTINEIIEDTLL